jgi:preprotein translocase subunit SecG
MILQKNILTRVTVGMVLLFCCNVVILSWVVEQHEGLAHLPCIFQHLNFA